MKPTTITAALTLLAITAVTTLGETILANKQLIELVGYLLVLSALAVLFTWGLIEAFKVVAYDPIVRARLNRPYAGTARDPDWKRRAHLYLMAVITGFLTTEAMGSVFLLLDGATRNMIIVVCIVWTVYAATVGMAVPIAYKKLFYRKFDSEAAL